MWQLAYLMKEKAHTSDSGVIYVDLPKNEQIGMIMIEFQCGSAAAATVIHTRSILDIVSDVSVLLEGSKTAVKLSAEVASGLAQYALGHAPSHRINNTSTQILRLPILFGRFPRDEAYMLDTSRYANAQLQITYSLNTTYETTATAQCTVWYERPVVKLPVAGFIRSRVVHTETTPATAGIRYVDLPVGLPWLRMGYRYYDFDNYFATGHTDVVLNVDDGRLTPFAGRVEDLVTLNEHWFGPHQAMCMNRAAAINTDTLPTFCAEQQMIAFLGGGGVAAAISVASDNGCSFELTWSGKTTHEALNYQAFGVCPFNMFLVYNGVLQPFDAPSHSDAQLELTIAAYAAKVEAWVQEVVEGSL